jgi:very-short-patch-repair endonuclease
MSARDAIGRALRYGDVHRFRLDWPHDPEGNGHAPTRAARDALEEAAKQIGLQYDVLDAEDFEAFREVAASDWSFAWQGRLTSSAHALTSAIETVIAARDTFAERVQLPQIGNDTGAVAALAGVASALPGAARADLSFALAGNGADTLDAFERQLERLEQYRGARRSLAVAYKDGHIAAAPVAAWTAALRAAEARAWPMRVFACRALRRTMRSSLGVDKKQAPAPERDLETLAKLTRIRHELDRAATELPSLNLWHGLETDAGAASAALAAGRRLRELVTRLAGFGHDLIELRGTLARLLAHGRDLLDPGQPIAEAARVLVEAHDGFERCLEAFRIEARRDEPAPSDLASILRSSRTIVERERRIRDWCRWIEVSRDARERGLGALVSALEEGGVGAADTVDAFRTAYAAWLAPILIDRRPELQRFSKVAHEDLIRTFRDLDGEVAGLTADYVRARLSGNVPDRNARNAGTGFGILAHELQKQRRHKPVRQLVTEMGSALTTLTPCLMMSPLSVAQFLSTDHQAFDLVVFDEASQITEPDAIGAIARGTRTIIVGDPKQMPPTRFFERGADESEENDEARDLESILDEALAARVPLHRLTGHYRSRHESLIAFSNHAYYDGALVTFPAADTRDTAVTFRRVDGVYAKGRSRTNPIEARELVAEVVRRLRDPELRHLSLGVVTLNTEQQRLVEDLLDQERRADPSLEPFFAGENTPDPHHPLEPVFVKNLETVQGDQRDVILLSIGYGPTEPGAPTMSMNFGPLNREGGERRLNVAITRATTEVVVFASFDPSMIDLSRTKARAVADLKHYVDFAARGPRALAEAVRSVSHNDYDSDFEYAVAEHLRLRGWEVRTQVGVSKFRIDLGIVHPDAAGRFLAGIECDGATYHRSPTARDRDRVRHIVLENLGWRLFRVWSTDFFVDERREMDDLDSKLRELLEADRAASAAFEERPTTDVWEDTANPPTADLEDGEALLAESHDESPPPPVPASTGAAHAHIAGRHGRGPIERSGQAGPYLEPDRFYDDDYLPTLKELAASIIDSEGPVVFRLLSERVARAHGFARTGSVIKRQVWRACQRLRMAARTPDDHVVFWPAGMAPSPIVGYRTLNDRNWSDVPYPEKLGLVQRARASDVDRTVRAVAALAGIGRVSEKVHVEIARLVEDLDQRTSGPD